MATFEDGVKALDSFRTAYTTDVLVRGNLSEADTRVKVIDRLLTDVLGWTEPAFTREEHVDSGFIDYVLRGPHPLLVIEAKKRDVHFRCPVERANRSYVTNT